MSRIVAKSYVEEGVEYTREFRLHGTGAGYSFPCNKDGEVSLSNQAARANYQACIDGTYDVEDQGVMSRSWRNRVPALLECDCGAEVYLGNFTNPCDCGADYNSRGNRLASRDNWGEETGEHWNECF